MSRLHAEARSTYAATSVSRVVLVVLLAVTGVAVADPRIVIVQTSDAPRFDSLATQIRVYAGQRVEVVSVTRPELGTAFTAQAAGVVAAEHATAIVWIAPLPEDGSFLVFAAGRWPGRALIELVRIPPNTPPGEAERSIALKIGALLDSLLVKQAPTSTLLGLPESPVPVAPARVDAWSVGVSGAFVREQGDRGSDGRAGLFTGYRRGWLGAQLEAYWQSTSDIEGAGGHVIVFEVGVRATLVVHHTFERWRLSIGPQLTAGAQHARGLALDGRASRATVFVPAAGVDVGVSRTIAPALRWFVGLEPEVSLIRQRFLVNGVATADLQRLRVAFATGLAIDL